MFLHFGFDCCQSTASIATERADMLKRDLLQRCLCMSALIVNDGCRCCFIINVHFVNLLVNVCGRGSYVLCMFLYIIIISETKCALLKYLALKKNTYHDYKIENLQNLFTCNFHMTAVGANSYIQHHIHTIPSVKQAGNHCLNCYSK